MLQSTKYKQSITAVIHEVCLPRFSLRIRHNTFLYKNMFCLRTPKPGRVAQTIETVGAMSKDKVYKTFRAKK